MSEHEQLIFQRFTSLEEKLELIYAQTLKTNGRMTTAEKDIVDIRLMMAEYKGKGTILTALWIFVGSIISGLSIHWLWGK